MNQIIWVLFHNWCCDRMVEINPHWNDEKIFQECRKFNIASNQYIAYNEVFSTIVGYKAMYDRNLLYPYSSLDGRSKYDPHCELNALNEFSNGAFRVLHAIIVACLK